MKYFLMTLIAIAVTSFTFSQDKIVKNNLSVVEGKVLRVDAINVEINPIGDKPFIIVPRDDIKLIIYDDNTVVSFEKSNDIDNTILLMLAEEIRRQQQEQDNIDSIDFNRQHEEQSVSRENGPAYGMGSRKAVGTLPLPKVDNCNVTSRLVVSVEIQIDRTGRVVAASIKSATFQDNCVWNAVLDASRNTKFTNDQNASFRQTGWIRYTLEP